MPKWLEAIERNEMALVVCGILLIFILHPTIQYVAFFIILLPAYTIGGEFWTRAPVVFVVVGTGYVLVVIFLVFFVKKMRKRA